MDVPKGQNFNGVYGYAIKNEYLQRVKAFGADEHLQLKVNTPKSLKTMSRNSFQLDSHIMLPNQKQKEVIQ